MAQPRRAPTAHETLQEQVTDLLTMTGWRWLHVRKSIAWSKGKGRGYQTTTNRKGWPDLAPIWSARQPSRHLAIEIKVPPDHLSSDQEEVRDELIAAGFEYYVITPADLDGLPAILARR
jgi:hypothetical protein